MRKGKIFWVVGLLVSLSPGACKDKPTPSADKLGEHHSPSLMDGVEDGESIRADSTNAPVSQEASAASDINKQAKAERSDKDILRDYFLLIAAGEREKADKMAIRTQSDCLLFMEPKSCEKTLEGQLEMQKTLDVDPIPRNSVLIDLGEGQKQSLEGKGGFLPDTTLWLGHTLRARGPGGKEFVMRSMGVLERQGEMRIIWGKRRAFKDTTRSPHLTPSAQPATEGK